MRELHGKIPHFTGSAVPALIAIAIAAGPATAQMDWNGSQSTSWINGLNWTPVGPPASDVEVLIDMDSPNATLINDWNVTAESVDIGVDDTGSLTILAGGTLTTDLSSFIGRFAGAEGDVTVTGTGSSWNMTQGLTVGNFGTASLMIDNGGTVDSGTHGNAIAVEEGSVGTVIVTDTGSAWNLDTFLAVGSRGNAQMLIDAGAEVNGDSLSVGVYSPASGTVTVSGAGSQLTIDDYLILGGQSGTGALLVENGATVMIGDWMRLAGSDQTEGTAVVTGDGSILNIGGDLEMGLNDVGSLSSFTVEAEGAVSVGGSIMVAVDPGSDSNLHVNANLSATAGTTINTGGWLDGDGALGGGTTTILGTIAPGSPVGTLSLRGLELSQGASLMFDLDDLGSIHDSLSVVQDLVLDGSLSVHNLGGLEEGDYTLITYGGSLIDQGLEIGNFPDGFTGIVHTDVPGEVRLQIVNVIFADQFEDS